MQRREYVSDGSIKQLKQQANPLAVTVSECQSSRWERGEGSNTVGAAVAKMPEWTEGVEPGEKACGPTRVAGTLDVMADAV